MQTLKPDPARAIAACCLFVALASGGCVALGRALGLRTDLETLDYRETTRSDPPEVVLVYRSVVGTISTRSVLACSVGPSGRPSCATPRIAP